MKLTTSQTALAIWLSTSILQQRTVAGFTTPTRIPLHQSASRHDSPAAFVPKFSTPHRTTLLHMAAEDFNESKYTESAWSAISALSKAADYYEVQTIEAPLLLDIMLNPVKHGAGEDAEAGNKEEEVETNHDKQRPKSIMVKTPKLRPSKLLREQPVNTSCTRIKQTTT